MCALGQHPGADARAYTHTLAYAPGQMLVHPRAGAAGSLEEASGAVALGVAMEPGTAERKFGGLRGRRAGGREGGLEGGRDEETGISQRSQMARTTSLEANAPGR